MTTAKHLEYVGKSDRVRSRIVIGREDDATVLCGRRIRGSRPPADCREHGREQRFGFILDRFEKLQIIGRRLSNKCLQHDSEGNLTNRAASRGGDVMQVKVPWSFLSTASSFQPMAEFSVGLHPVFPPDLAPECHQPLGRLGCKSVVGNRRDDRPGDANKPLLCQSLPPPGPRNRRVILLGTCPARLSDESSRHSSSAPRRAASLDVLRRRPKSSYAECLGDTRVGS
jgi:hypothetical protein